MYEEIARIVDVNIYISKVAKEGFDRLGLRSYWMPIAGNPNVFRPTERKTKDVVFIGQPYGVRPYFFWRMLQYGVDLHIYGNGWNDIPREKQRSKKKTIRKIFNKYGFDILRLGDIDQKLRKLDNEIRSAVISKINSDYGQLVYPSLSDDEYTKRVATAGAVINIAESRYNHDFLNHKVVYGANLREFETTMSGTLLFTQYSDEIESLFDIGKEICCYHNEHDLAEKVHYYMRNDIERERIAKAGYERAIRDHTWERRFEDFLNWLNI